MRIFSLPVFSFSFFIVSVFSCVTCNGNSWLHTLLYSTTVRGVYVIIYLCIQATELVSIHRFIHDSDSSRFVSSSSSRVFSLSPLLTFSVRCFYCLWFYVYGISIAFAHADERNGQNPLLHFILPLICTYENGRKKIFKDYFIEAQRLSQPSENWNGAQHFSDVVVVVVAAIDTK